MSGRTSERLQRFRRRHRLKWVDWANAAGISRPTLSAIVNGSSVPHLQTVRAIVAAASDLTGEAVRVGELFEVGEDTPVRRDSALVAKLKCAERGASAAITARTAYATRLDNVLRTERIIANAFADAIGVTRQSLLRFRCGENDPDLQTLAVMVATLRRTGKPFMAADLYDFAA